MNNEDRLRRLNRTQFEVTQRKATEAPFSGIYWDSTEEGIYRCVVCGRPLFSSEHKKPSDGERIPGLSGWPSFVSPIDGDSIVVKQDHSHGMIRDAMQCAGCGAHIGHVFALSSSGTESGMHYCANSASLDLDRTDRTE
jgi:peptide-methionine (R)-S-oxide reductase